MLQKQLIMTPQEIKSTKEGTWLNLPFPLNVKTKLRKIFLKLVTKTFPKFSIKIRLRLAT